MISLKEFLKIDLRTATIVEVKDHPNADRLYLMKVDLGNEIKQCCAGIKSHYSKEELTGKKVVVVANLEPAMLRGEKSEVMLLAAVTERDEDIVLLQPEKELSNGVKVR